MRFVLFVLFLLGLGNAKRSIGLKDKDVSQQRMLRSSDLNGSPKLDLDDEAPKPDPVHEKDRETPVHDKETLGSSDPGDVTRSSRAEDLKESDDKCESRGVELEDVLERVKNLANLKETSLCAAQQRTYQFIVYDHWIEGYSCKSISTVCNLNANLVSLVLTGDQRPDHVFGSFGTCNYDDIPGEETLRDYLNQDRFQDGRVHVHVLYILLKYAEEDRPGGTIPHIFALLQQGNRGVMVQSYVSIYDMKTFLHHSPSSSHSGYKTFEWMRQKFGGSQILDLDHFTGHIDHARDHPGAFGEGWAIAEDKQPRRKLACLLWDNMFSGTEHAVNDAGCEEKDGSKLHIKLSVASNPVCKSLHDLDTELHEMSQRHCKIGTMCEHEREAFKKDRYDWPVHPKGISEVWKERERAREIRDRLGGIS